MKKVLIIIFLIFVKFISNAQNHYFIDCPYNISPFLLRYDSICNYNFDYNFNRCLDNFGVPITEEDQKLLLNKTKIPLSSFRFLLIPSSDFREFIINGFSRNYCFKINEDTNKYVQIVNEYTDISHSKNINILDELEIHPISNVGLRDIYSKMSNEEISLLETLIVNGINFSLSDFTDYYIDTISPEKIVYSPIHSFYIEYENNQYFNYLANSLDEYLDESPFVYSIPNKNGKRLNKNSLVLFSDGSKRNHVGIKFPINIESFIHKYYDPDKNEKSDTNDAFEGRLLFSDLGCKVISDFIGVVYINDKNVTETLWIKKQDLYSKQKDKTLENILEMMLTNKIINKLYHEEY